MAFLLKIKMWEIILPDPVLADDELLYTSFIFFSRLGEDWTASFTTSGAVLLPDFINLDSAARISSSEW